MAARTRSARRTKGTAKAGIRPARAKSGAKSLTALEAAYKEALEQQAATREILSIIAASRGDVRPVLDAVAASAARLCEAHNSHIMLRDGDDVRYAAHYGPLSIGGQTRLSRDTVAGRCMLERKQIHVHDMQAEIREYPLGGAIARKHGYHTIVATPLMHGPVAIGAVVVRRKQIRPFSERQLELVRAFAAQAAIAIENARLFNETKEALERQSATSEILRVISASPTDTQPVFDAIVQNAQRLLSAKSAVLLLRRGTDFVMAGYSMPDMAHLPEDVRVAPLDPSKNFPSRAILDGEVVHVPDWDAEAVIPHEKAVGKALGIGSALIVPLLRDGAGIGAVGLTREKKGPFHEKEIALLRSFADQAVIAIENVRLFNETKEALERQTASAEVLRVISGTVADPHPVFQAIAQSAQRVFGAFHTAVALIEGGALHRKATAGPGDPRTTVFPLDRTSSAGNAVLNRRPYDVSDTESPDALPYARDSGRAVGFRAVASAPMLRDGKGIGVVTVMRKEAGAFSEKQLELLQTFADQAVIAIENARLFNETKEALERQTATSEVLRVISSSPTDVQPVFDTILSSATRLCDAERGLLFRTDGELFHVVAALGLSAEARAQFMSQPVRPGPLSGLGRISATKRPVHVADVTSDEAYRNGDPLRMRTAKLLGARTAMWLPLLKGEAVIGALAIYRQEVKPFTDEQIALVQTFADQAVIAIENVRLFNETKEALEQQTAISEVLRVISGSPTDVKPVLEAVAMRAAKICDATDARIMLVEAGGTMLRHAAGFGDFPPKVDLFPLNRDTSAGRAIIDGAPFQIPDIAAAPADEYKLGRELAAKAGWRTAMSVPLMREDRALGAIALRRREARPFSEKQISLLKVFADQAAIAIENVRLFNETKESLERQTATADILRVISSSPTDIQPVMRAVAQSAARLCDATDVIIRRVEGEVMPAVEHIGAIPLGEAAMAPRINKNTINGRAILECRSIHITDVMAPDVSAEYPEGLFLQNPGSFRSILVVPMRREGRAIGSIIVRHAKVRPFSDQQIKLLETFADQAVIAIENVRLFNELGARNRDLGESLEQQTATADILRVISSSPTDLKPVLDAVAQRSAQLCNASDAAIFNVEGETLRRVAHFGSIPFTSAGALRKVTLGTVAGRSVIERRTIHEHDILQAHARGEYPEGPALQRPVGYRTVLVAPLLREGAAIGAIVIRRMEVNPFSDKQIKLLETFADQAVIAIENVRLFREIQEKSAQLEVANKHKSDFLANMSHELRTPLNAIIGFSEVLIDKMFGEVNAKQLDYLKDIHESGRHLLSLINDILDLSKIEAGRMELELCSFHLPSAISNAMTLVRERAQRHGIQLGAEIDERLGELQADERKFKQIMLNLLSNAVKFTPDGGRVDVSAKRDTTRVEIAVRDTGVGIAPADQAALFEEFKQVGRDGARKAEGTGLGLALTKRFVELHGGEIRVQSAPGKGSTFTVSLPIR